MLNHDISYYGIQKDAILNDDLEYEHQVVSPRIENSSLIKLIRVSRTFANGTRQFKLVMKLPDNGAQCFDLHGDGDSN